MINNQERYCWLIAYIDSAYITKTKDELQKYPEYEDVEAFIPTIKILNKTFKKEEHFLEVPLLFNYGFFKIPRSVAVYQSYLEQMQRNISCIFAWVKDPVKKIITQKPKNLTDYHVNCATATPIEIAKLVRDSFTMTAHTYEELSRFKSGDFIVLRGYPWDGINAQIIEIDDKRRKVQVQIEIFSTSKPMWVDFDNVFFSVYQDNNFDDKLSNNESLDKPIVDKQMFKMQTNEGN